MDDAGHSYTGARDRQTDTEKERKAYLRFEFRCRTSECDSKSFGARDSDAVAVELFRKRLESFNELSH